MKSSAARIPCFHRWERREGQADIASTPAVLATRWRWPSSECGSPYCVCHFKRNSLFDACLNRLFTLRLNWTRGKLMPVVINCRPRLMQLLTQKIAGRKLRRGIDCYLLLNNSARWIMSVKVRLLDLRSQTRRECILLQPQSPRWSKVSPLTQLCRCRCHCPCSGCSPHTHICIHTRAHAKTIFLGYPVHRIPDCSYRRTSPHKESMRKKSVTLTPDAFNGPIFHSPSSIFLFLFLWWRLNNSVL